mmetsp:Transcript_31654/g.73912  ORF Transcript_31654/g.73912 Transcript_31654/m.73912 type:complete len:331 (-) Transcript_31654:202-1194(-)|eukprot:CAMPEP_0178408542 /NCGR_PEP_ID=MMETSP0689_2-20121128/19997_1 /TAXON_ID=160604 /ORGANISM="Amphidinium massartii, Strain CS-259" /LENGTH=330 /DNA_ID=CAMNT_0020029649 /DNA_START=27 /DNA_END=1019 /DNA_ORIENTATION=+
MAVAVASEYVPPEKHLPHASKSGSPLDMLQVRESELTVFEKVGEGVAAEVFRGEFRGVTVAIKQVTLSERTGMSAQDKALLAREVAINARVSYEHLVRFFGISLGNSFRIVTEYCSGGTCFDLLHNRKHIELTWRQRHQMMSDTACGVNYLHEFTPQIIHRDLKSLNLLLAEEVFDSSIVPKVKVADFGLARMKDNACEAWVKLTPATGTAHWMSPEAFGSNYDAKVDVYSYAMVLFEVICRKVPFQEVESAVVERYTKQGIRPGLGVVPEDCPKTLVELMVSCWAQKKEARPNFGHIIAELNAVRLQQGFDTKMARQESDKSSKAVLCL